jgi:hypothetical protein
MSRTMTELFSNIIAAVWCTVKAIKGFFSVKPIHMKQIWQYSS